MKTINKKDNQIVFQAEIEESLANAIRRYIGQIPILAIDEIEISKNDSALYDETVAHRIGLLPLKMEKSFNEKTEAILRLAVNKAGIVHANELKGKLSIIYPQTPIVYLDNNQELELTATARVGKGYQHSKFSSGLMFYRNIIDVKLEKDCPEGVIGVCPSDVFSLESGKLVVKNLLDCDMCEACAEFCQKKGKEGVKLIPTKDLLITLESFGQLPTEDLLSKAVEQLKKDLRDVSKELK